MPNSINLSKKLFYQYQPKIGKEVNIIYSPISQELILRSYINEIFLFISKKSWIKKAIFLMNGRNSIGLIKQKCRINNKQILTLFSWLKSNKFLSIDNKKADRNIYSKLLKIPFKQNKLFFKDKNILMLGINKVNLQIINKLLKMRVGSIKIYHPKNISKDVDNRFVCKFLMKDDDLELCIKKSDLIIGGFLKEYKKTNLRINNLVYLHDKKWLFYEIDIENYLINIGPLVTKNSKGCYSCYSRRVEENKIFRESDYLKKASAQIPDFLSKDVEEIAVNNIFNFLTKRTSNVVNKVMTVYLNKQIKKVEYLIPKPDCKYCIKQKRNNNLPKLKSRIAKSQENGLRSLSLKSTYLKLLKLIGHIGLISKLLVVNDRVFSFSAGLFYSSRGRWHFGKGITPVQKSNSALAEAIERYCSKTILDKIIVDTRNNVKDIALDSKSFNLISYSEDDRPIKWFFVTSLYDQKKYLFPLDSIFGTNGLAAGNNLEEAILQGTFEVVERDAHMIMDLNSLCMPDVNMNGFDFSKYRAIFSYLHENKMQYWIKYITNDIAIPSFGVFIKNKNKYSYAPGTHLNKEIALSRAITEAIQLLNTDERWLKRDISHYSNPSLVSINFDNIQSFNSIDILENINECKRILKNKSEIFLCNLSQPYTGFSVVKMISTNLQSSWCNCHPYFTKRLFEVPKILGYEGKTKHNLNYGDICGHKCGFR